MIGLCKTICLMIPVIARTIITKKITDFIHFSLFVQQYNYRINVVCEALNNENDLFSVMCCWVAQTDLVKHVRFCTCCTKPAVSVAFNRSPGLPCSSAFIPRIFNQRCCLHHFSSWSGFDLSPQRRHKA